MSDITPAFALAMATLRRFASSVQPTLPAALAQRKLMITRSASCPCAASMVLTFTLPLQYSASFWVSSACWPLYGVSTKMLGEILVYLLVTAPSAYSTASACMGLLGLLPLMLSSGPWQWKLIMRCRGSLSAESAPVSSAPGSHALCPWPRDSQDFLWRSSESVFEDAVVVLDVGESLDVRVHAVLDPEHDEVFEALVVPVEACQERAAESVPFRTSVFHCWCQLMFVPHNHDMTSINGVG